MTRAAAQRGLTQQAVSAQLSKLRGTFQDHLFLRSAQGLIPTPLAEQLEPRVNTVFESIAALSPPDRFDPAEVYTTFVISATDYAVAVIFPTLLATVLPQAPQ